MFEFYYPGQCFGNIDINSKECKKCKIKSYCTHKNSSNIFELGVSSFIKCLYDNFTCNVEKNKITCYKNSEDTPFVVVLLEETGSIIIKKDKTEKIIQHIVSKEQAENFFKKYILE